MEHKPEQIAVYSRKSRFTGKGESVGNQVELCRDYIRAVYGEEAAEGAAVFEDEGFSGKNLDRPGFRRMMQAARGRCFRAIVVYRLDRISRNIGDFAGLIEELNRLGVGFISIRESFDTSTPIGRAMLYIASVFSQLERETIAERIRDNLRELAKTGRWLGGITPTGYESESVERTMASGKSGRLCRLRLIPDEAETVCLIYRLYAETDSLSAVEAELMQRGVTTKNGRSFTRFSIRAILQNPVYLIADDAARRYFEDSGAELFAQSGDFDGLRGMLAYNRTEQEKGRAAVTLPMEQWIVSVGEHPGLIPSALWIQTQRALARNRQKSYRRPRKNEALLTGRIFCECGGRMYPKLTGRAGRDGRPAFVYVCKTKARSKGALCAAKNAPGEALDNAILNKIAALEEDADAFTAALTAGMAFAEAGEKASDAAALIERRERLHRRVNDLIDALPGFDEASAFRVTQRIRELSEEEAALREKIAERERAEEVAEENALAASEEALLLSMKRCVRAMTVEQRRAAVRAAVGRVVWNGSAVRVEWTGVNSGDIGERLCEDSK